MTTIKSAAADNGRVVHIDNTEGVGVWVTTENPGTNADIAIRVDRAEFLAAVAAELDVIVIPRADLPKVTGYAKDHREGREFVTFEDGLRRVETNDNMRRLALAYLAAEEYAEKHPPVDEAEVSTLADLLIGADMDGEEGPTPTTVARRLLATGRIYLAKEA